MNLKRRFEPNVKFIIIIIITTHNIYINIFCTPPTDSRIFVSSISTAILNIWYINAYYNRGNDIIVFDLKYINRKLKTVANMLSNSVHVHVNLIIFIAIIWLWLLFSFGKMMMKSVVKKMHLVTNCSAGEWGFRLNVKITEQVLVIKKQSEYVKTKNKSWRVRNVKVRTNIVREYFPQCNVQICEKHV